MLTCTIGGVAYTIDEPQFKLSPKLEERWKCTLYVWDYTGTVFFSYGQKVTVTDPLLGRLFTGYVAEALQDKTYTYPDATTLHRIDCLDPRHLPEKRTSNRLYTTPVMAGKIAADLVSDVLAAEGVLANYAVQFVTTPTDWMAGMPTNVIATPYGDGDLELVTSGASVSTSYMTQANWATGTGSSVQLNPDGTVGLIQVVRTWNDGSKANQTLYGLGSPSDSVSSGVYRLSSTKANETRARLDFAGTWSGSYIFEVDINIQAATERYSVTWQTTNFTNGDGSFAYAIELLPGSIELRLGTNGGANSSSSLGLHTFSPALANGWYRLRVQKSGPTHTISLGGVTYISVSDSTYAGAAYIALRNRNMDTAQTITAQFDNFGVVSALSGTWISPSVSVNSVSSVTRSVITWDDSLSTGGTVQVQTSTDGGSTYQTCTNGGSIPTLGPGASGTGKSVLVKVTLSTTNTSLLSIIRNVQWSVIGGYVASGNRTTVPLAIDYMDRANQSGLGTADDGQTYTKVGTGTDAIANNEATITNTTGDVFERLGTKTAGDSEDSTRFALPNSTMKQGVVLRYVDANNWYALVAQTSTLSIVKCANGVQTTLATAPVSLVVATYYRMRLRAVGIFPVALGGRTWVDGQAEPIASPFQVIAQDF